MSLFYSIIFLLLEGNADSIGAGLCMMGPHGDLICYTIGVAGMIHTVLHVASNTLIGLAIARNFIFHLSSLLFRNSKLIIPNLERVNTKNQNLTKGGR